MTAQKSLRKKFSSLLATGTVALLAASGIALAPTAAFADEPVTPTVTLSKTTLNPNGDLITVTGSGFLPTPPATNGARPPLAGKFGGSYVVFGSFLDTWKPSESAPSSARKVLVQKWGVLAEDMNTIGGPNAGAIEIKPDGTFTANLVVKKDDAQALADGNYGIYTYGGSGANYAPFETYTPVTFSTADPAPSVTATADAVRGTLDVQFDLANVTSTTGAYISVIEAGKASELSQSNLGIASDWIMPSQFTSGSASRTLSIPAEDLDRNKQYEVLSWKAHTFPNVGEVYALGVPLQVTPEQWDTLYAPAEATTTTVSAAPASVKVGEKVTLTATVAPAAAGTVQFFNGSAAIGDAVAVNGGVAKLQTTLPEGANAITATFTPTSALDFEPSTSAAVTVNVTKPVDPKPTAPTFTDVKKGDKFYQEIAWMAAEGISTGVKQANGTYQYQPKNNVTREAMAAFLYRQYGDKNFKAPAKSPFADVKPGDKFYQEIAWMAAEGISTGVKQANGTVKFQPKAGITREAMAAFMYRIDDAKKPGVPAVSPFADVKKGDKFYKEIAWMSQSGLSTGIKQPSGKPVYAPKSNVTREAMAAFLYRAAAD